MALIFCKTWWVSSTTPVVISSIVSGTKGICPETYNVFSTFTAWLYGPIAAGALVVLRISFFDILTCDKNIIYNGYDEYSNGNRIDGIHDSHRFGLWIFGLHFNSNFVCECKGFFRQNGLHTPMLYLFI